jgi:hypothetical protein
MSDDAVATLVFAALALLLVTAGIGQVFWVFLFDEFIGVANPPADAPPPARFEVVLAPVIPVACPAGHGPVQVMTPGR